MACTNTVSGNLFLSQAVVDRKMSAKSPEGVPPLGWVEGPTKVVGMYGHALPEHPCGDVVVDCAGGRDTVWDGRRWTPVIASSAQGHRPWGQCDSFWCRAHPVPLVFPVGTALEEKKAFLAQARQPAPVVLPPVLTFGDVGDVEESSCVEFCSASSIVSDRSGTIPITGSGPSVAVSVPSVRRKRGSRGSRGRRARSPAPSSASSVPKSVTSEVAGDRATQQVHSQIMKALSRHRPGLTRQQTHCQGRAASAAGHDRTACAACALCLCRACALPRSVGVVRKRKEWRPTGLLHASSDACDGLPMNSGSPCKMCANWWVVCNNAAGYSCLGCTHARTGGKYRRGDAHCLAPPPLAERPKKQAPPRPPPPKTRSVVTEDIVEFPLRPRRDTFVVASSAPSVVQSEPVRRPSSASLAEVLMRMSYANYLRRESAPGRAAEVPRGAWNPAAEPEPEMVVARPADPEVDAANELAAYLRMQTAFRPYSYEVLEAVRRKAIAWFERAPHDAWAYAPRERIMAQGISGWLSTNGPNNEVLGSVTSRRMAVYDLDERSARATGYAVRHGMVVNIIRAIKHSAVVEFFQPFMGIQEVLPLTGRRG